MGRTISKCQMTCKKLCSLPIQSTEEEKEEAALYICQHHLRKDQNEHDAYVFLT